MQKILSTTSKKGKIGSTRKKQMFVFLAPRMLVIEPVFRVKSSNWHHRFAKSTEKMRSKDTRHDSTMVGRCRRGRLDALSRASMIPAARLGRP